MPLFVSSLNISNNAPYLSDDILDQLTHAIKSLRPARCFRCMYQYLHDCMTSFFAGPDARMAITAIPLLPHGRSVWNTRSIRQRLFRNPLRRADSNGQRQQAKHFSTRFQEWRQKLSWETCNFDIESLTIQSVPVRPLDPSHQSNQPRSVFPLTEQQVHEASVHNSTFSPLYKLPTELYLLILSYIHEDLDIMALRTTCHRFSKLSADPLALLQSKQPRSNQRVRILARRYATLVESGKVRLLANEEREGELPLGMLSCSSCMMAHPVSQFFDRAREVEPEMRNCKGVEGVLEVCPHRRRTFAGMQNSPVQVKGSICKGRTGVYKSVNGSEWWDVDWSYALVAGRCCASIGRAGNKLTEDNSPSGPSALRKPILGNASKNKAAQGNLGDEDWIIRREQILLYCPSAAKLDAEHINTAMDENIIADRSICPHLTHPDVQGLVQSHLSTCPRFARNPEPLPQPHIPDDTPSRCTHEDCRNTYSCPDPHCLTVFVLLRRPSEKFPITFDEVVLFSVRKLGRVVDPLDPAWLAQIVDPRDVDPLCEHDLEDTMRMQFRERADERVCGTYSVGQRC